MGSDSRGRLASFRSASVNRGLSIMESLTPTTSLSFPRIMMHKFQPRRSTGVFHMRIHFVMAALTTLTLLTHSIEAADYKYPYRDPYLATATTAILSDEGATARVTSILSMCPGFPAEITCLPSKDAAMWVLLFIAKTARRRCFSSSPALDPTPISGSPPT